MLKKILLFSFACFIVVTGYSQDTAWQQKTIQAACTFEMPSSMVITDTTAIKDGFAAHIKMYQYSTDDMVLQVISTEMYKPGEKIERGDEIQSGYRQGVEKGALNSGMTVKFKDTTLGGMPCTKSILKNGLMSVIMYAVFHDRYLYAFSTTVVEPTKAARRDLGRFMNSIQFTKELELPAEIPMKSYSSSSRSHTVGILRIISIIALVISGLLALLRKRKTG